MPETTASDARKAASLLRRLGWTVEPPVRAKLTRTKTEDLYGADPKCKHMTYAAPGGGIKCSKCPGWFCY